MNKKFSTLLAAALVAGGLGSSAFATNFPIGKYVQLKTADGKYLVVGESSVRDSLALVDVNYVNPSSIEDVNKSLWKFIAKEVKDANGLSAGYEVYLENKVNGGIVLTKQDASATSAYYAPGAVVTPGTLKLAGFSSADGKTVTSSGVANTNLGISIAADEVDFCGTAAYDAATKTVRKYVLGRVTSTGAIKLFVISKDASEVEKTSELNAIIKEVNEATLDVSGVTELGTLTATAIADPTTIDLTVSLLNEMGNDGFDLEFTPDITSNAKYANPFSANTLSAVDAVVYTSASYDTDDYDAAMAKYTGEDETTAPGVIAGIDAQKAAAQAYVKELKVALNETGAQGKVENNAPNASEIELAKDGLGANNFNGSAKEAITKLIEAGEALEYAANNEVADADAKAKDLNDKLAKVEETLNAAKSTVSAVVANMDKAVQDFVKGAYRYTGEKIPYADYTIKVKHADINGGEEQEMQCGDAVRAVADAVLAGDWNTYVKALGEQTNEPTVTASSEIKSFYTGVEDLSDYMPIAVVGEADTYVTVDTNYVATNEKYLALGTTKLNQLVIVKASQSFSATVDNEDVTYTAGQVVPAKAAYKANGDLADATALQEILVPEFGKNVLPALFRMNIDLSATSADKITIFGNAPVVKNQGSAPKHYKEFKDINNLHWQFDEQVVIRTLGSVREASIMQTGEKDDVKKNTTITFDEPVLATKINNGDIYFIINKNVADEDNYDKYLVYDPIDAQVYAKEAYLNVPATQWVVEKNNDSYTLKNRDYNSNYNLGSSKKIYAVDEDNMIYTSTARDTFQLVAADAAKEGHVGYKYISEEIQKITDFALSAVNYANVETPYYLTFNGNEDSILTATSNKEEALVLIPMIVENKQVTEEYKMNDENLTKQFYQLIAKDGEDTLYLNVENSGELIVSKVKPVVNEDLNRDDRLFLQFRNINDVANAYEVLIGTWDKNSDDPFDISYKLSYNQDGEAIAVPNDQASAFVYDLVDNSTDIYKNFGFEGSTKVIISLNGDAESKVTKIGPFATVKRTGLDETIDADYSLIMDTAYVDHKDNIRYAYYITKPIVAADTAWNAEKFYMVSYADSVTANRSNDTIKYSQDGLTRIGFVAAKRLGTDSLAITKAVGAVATDTLNVTEELGVTNATFAFAIDENNEEAYRIEVGPNRYVSYLNGILVEGAKEQAQLFNVNATDLTPTDNEEISVEAGVQVIGGKGAVTVQGAAGKTVTVYNFQGRALASTTLTSDNQTIAVPAGLVAVSVEGEPEAISVVVK